MFHKPAVVLRKLDSVQQGELQKLLSPTGRVQQSARRSAVSAGWQLLEVDHKEWQPGVPLAQYKGTNALVWAKFGDPESEEVRVTPAAAAAAQFYSELVRLRVAVRLVETAGPRLVAAADAFAEGGRAGIGGWWLRPGCTLRPDNIFWFSCCVAPADLPDWFGCSAALERVISALEALAQLVLCALVLREEPLGCRPAHLGRLALRQYCDNSAVVGAVAKGSSMSAPLAGVIQATARLCLQHGIALKVAHVAGHKNHWADVLSRGRQKDPDFWDQLSAAKRRHLDWAELLQGSGVAAQVPSKQSVDSLIRRGL